jgi:hypothetical protein
MRQMWNEFSTLPIFDIKTCNAPQKISQSNICEKKNGFDHFRQKIVLFTAKKNLTAIFL